MLTNKILPPPWIVFPDLASSSAAFRLGTREEEYAEKWRRWVQRMNPADYRAYVELFPEPIMWLGTLAEVNAAGSAEADGDACEEERKKRQTQNYTREMLIEAFRRGERRGMRCFWGHQPARNGALTPSCFSQWWQSEFTYRDQVFSCMEQVMMASKARLFGDEEIYRQIMQSNDPAKIKKLGRQVKGFDDAVWDRHKFNCILMGNYCKFAANPELRAYLLSTGDEILVEASPYDRIWGIGLAAEDARVTDPAQWLGENLLGFALMQVRDEIRRVFANVALCCDPWE